MSGEFGVEAAADAGEGRGADCGLGWWGVQTTKCEVVVRRFDDAQKKLGGKKK